MGFGTLFIGYFFLINISYYAYTDIIAGMVILLALYKLSSVDKSFKRGAASAIGFCALAFAELIFVFISMFASFEWLNALTPYVSAMRFALIFVLTYFMLSGIRDVAKEVDAPALYRTATASVPLCFVFVVYAAFEIPFVGGLFGAATPYISFALLLSVVLFIVSNLVTVYKSYMQICMPEDLKKETKKSKFGFINNMYDSIEKKSAEYAAYKLDKRKNKKRKK